MTVEVLPPDVRDEWEASWYRERLDDPALLDQAVVVVVGGSRHMVVPRGGRRRGGALSVGDVAVIWLLRDALAGLEGFPDVRVRWATHPDSCHAIEWGDPVPNTDDDRVRGRYFGYSDRAIVAYAEEMASREQ
ncbi:hypothetical protein QR97_31505 [Streptomyces sp. PBH53]|uniref:DUF6302 family protein n=1 Tax=Streptomyces sp. PBH53 TaxID=1577075 RepID=UPI00065666EA|nr:DUF6302 family protein [Streptomyces sp. PBH53]AKN75677.1 hypothetical protein QR97_31505 [Streptomyces sp. PBH53]